MLGHPIALDLESLVRQLINNRRGGCCFQRQILVQAGLQRGGYRAPGLASRRGSDYGLIRPRTHTLVRVELLSGRCIVDAGFGGDGLLHPARLLRDTSVCVGMSHLRPRSDGLLRALWVERQEQSRDL